MATRDSGAIDLLFLKQDATEKIGSIDCPLLDREALVILESLKLNTFEDVLNAFEEFLSNIHLFEGTTSFAKAATALDMASVAFLAIDANHDFLLSKEELQAYILSGAARAEHLDWLLSKFDALEQLSFFVGGVSRSEIEAARDLFHGLNCLKAHFSDKYDGKQKHVVSKEEIMIYLREHEAGLEAHDARGLRGLVNYLGRVEQILTHHV